MANPFINARESILFINTTSLITVDGATLSMANFVAIACLTNVSFAGTTSAIAATSKCSGKFSESIGGEESWTMSAEGLAIPLEVSDVRQNHNDLFKFWRAGNAAWFLIANKSDLQASVTIRYGVGRIDSQSDAFPDNAAQTFSTSITGIGYAFDQDNLVKTP